MTIWTDNAARFATTQVDVEVQIRIILANLQIDLKAARRTKRSWSRRERIRAQQAALATAAIPLERLARASGRAGVQTFEISALPVRGDR